jgi:hypothetical protein
MDNNVISQVVQVAGRTVTITVRARQQGDQTIGYTATNSLFSPGPEVILMPTPSAAFNAELSRLEECLAIHS